MDERMVSYVGVIGGIAGIIGAIISVRSYYLARSFNVLDLRLQAETLALRLPLLQDPGP